MIISSLANMNVNEIYPSSELEERNSSSTSNLSIGQAIGEEWVMSFINEEPTHVLEHNSTHSFIVTFSDTDGSSNRDSRLYISDGQNTSQLASITSTSNPKFWLISSNQYNLIFLERNSSSSCELKQYNMTTGHTLVKGTITTSSGCSFRDSILNKDGGSTLLLSGSQQISANGVSYSSVRSSNYGPICTACPPVCSYYSYPSVFVVIGVDANGSERWQVGGSGYQEESFLISSSGNNSSIISAKMSQTSVSPQCGTRPSWQVGATSYNSNSRMYFEMGVNGNILSSSSSGTASSRAVAINNINSVKLDNGGGSNQYCSGSDQCSLVFNSIQSGTEVNRVDMNLTGDYYLTSPRKVSANGDVLLTMCLRNSNQDPASIFDSQYFGYSQALIRINSSMGIILQEVGSNCYKPN